MDQDLSPLEQLSYNLNWHCGECRSEIRLHILCRLILIYTVHIKLVLSTARKDLSHSQLQSLIFLKKKEVKDMYFYILVEEEVVEEEEAQEISGVKEGVREVVGAQEVAEDVEVQGEGV